MTKLTLIALLTTLMLTTASANGMGGMMTDMMDIPKEIITSGTDAIKDMKDAAKDSMDEVKDNAIDSVDDMKDAVPDTTTADDTAAKVEKKVSPSKEVKN